MSDIFKNPNVDILAEYPAMDLENKKKERDIRKCECDTCGSSYECRYDKANDEYICEECLDLEEEKESDLDGIREEIAIHIEEESLDPKKDFESFFADIDVINAYEENWNERKELYKPMFKTIWNELQ